MGKAIGHILANGDVLDRKVSFVIYLVLGRLEYCFLNGDMI